VPFESSRTDLLNREPPAPFAPPRIEPVNPEPTVPFDSSRTDPLNREPPLPAALRAASPAAKALEEFRHLGHFGSGRRGAGDGFARPPE
jgi:hypothetical protein